MGAALLALHGVDFNAYPVLLISTAINATFQINATSAIQIMPFFLPLAQDAASLTLHSVRLVQHVFLALIHSTVRGVMWLVFVLFVMRIRLVLELRAAVNLALIGVEQAELGVLHALLQ